MKKRFLRLSQRLYQALWLKLQRQRFLIVSLIVLLAAYSGFLSSLPAPVTLTTLSGVTEQIQFTVTDRRLGTIPTAGMRLATDKEGQCLPTTVIPDIGTVVSYRRTLTSRVIVSLEKGGAIVPKTDNAPGSRITGPVDFIADEMCQANIAPEFQCDAKIASSCSQHRLPIWGRVSLGRESTLAGQGGGTFLEGTLKVQARALPEYGPFWIGDPSMYAVLDMTLPVGARIEANDTDDRPSSWWGLGYVDPQKPGLQIILATEAPAFKIFRPFPTTPDLITVSGFTQSMQDPNLVRIQIFILGFLGIVNLVVSIRQLFEKS